LDQFTGVLLSRGWLAGAVQRPHVRLQKCVVVVVGAEADDERVLLHVHEQDAVEEEADATEQLPRFDTTLQGQRVTDALGQGVIEAIGAPICIFRRSTTLNSIGVVRRGMQLDGSHGWLRARRSSALPLPHGQGALRESFLRGMVPSSFLASLACS
jgi:hypothetical protein